MRRLTLQEDVAQMFSAASARARVSPIEVIANTPEPQESDELTPEEEQELMQYAIGRMSGTQQAQEEPAAPQPEPEVVEEYSNLPKEERPIRVDFSNVREETLRFSDAEWFNTVKQQVVILAGVGGIGSNMAMILAKLNPRALYLFDNDVVDTVNLAGQFYSSDDIGKYKVDSLAENIIKFTNYSSVFACNRAYLEGESIVGDIMICGFDTMRARKSYYKAWKTRLQSLTSEQKKACLFIDGRLTATEFQILCITGEDDYYMSQYETRFLFDEYQAQYTRCSFKQTGYLADMIGAFMVNLFVNFCANLSNPARNMPLPFLTSYRADVMYFNTEV